MKHTPEEEQAHLARRRATLASLLNYNAPDILIYDAMRLVADSMRRVHGRRWNRIPIRSKLRNWWRYRVRMNHTLAALEEPDDNPHI